MPSALESQITAANVQSIRPTVRLIAEGANGPTTPDADKVIAERGIFVIPDFLANAGGVTCSYFEQVQSNMNYFWEKDEVLGKLDVKMTSAFHAVSELAARGSCTCGTRPMSSPSAGWRRLAGRAAGSSMPDSGLPVFDRRFLDGVEPFTVIGNGSIGGKAAGLARIRTALATLDGAAFPASRWRFPP